MALQRCQQQQWQSQKSKTEENYLKILLLYLLHMGLHIVDDCCLYKSEMVEIHRIESLQDIHPSKRTKFVGQIDRERFHHKLSTKSNEKFEH